MKTHGIGVGYQFPHDFEGDDVAQQYLPDELVGRRYYVPNDQGHEVAIAARMAEREASKTQKPRRKNRPSPPMASMSDALRPAETSRRKIAETQREDAGG
jgi:putative ATPase